MTCELILGGARSGKSREAERRAAACGLAVTVIATAEAGDAEMAARIRRHRADRPAAWRTVEAPLALADALAREAAPERCLVVDCLTLWLSNLLAGAETLPPAAGADSLPRFRHEREALLAVLPTLPGRVLLVANEVGLGLVPETPLGRLFRDEAGRLNQAMAALCPTVVFVAAGLPLVLKQGQTAASEDAQERTMGLPDERMKMTTEEFLAWEAAQLERWEFIAGEAFAMAGGSDVHNTISLNMAFALRERLRGSRCSVFMSDVKLRLATDDTVFYPDVFASCDAADRARRQVKEAPLLIAEVLSPSTEAYDRGRKFEAYRRFAGLQTVLFLAQERRHLECYTRTADGDWLLTEAGGEDAVLAVPALGFELPLAELYRHLPVVEAADEGDDEGRGGGS
jgi:adenosylcobinamide kinase/adenosylcobinamide-phosphate guanylyltransferase